jgi:acylphosphatase
MGCCNQYDYQPMKTVHAMVSGRVQGVFYRAWTRNQAHKLRLKGWVRNLPDGKVEVLAQGPDNILEGFVTLLRQGPPLSRVDQVDSRYVEDVAEIPVGFHIG